FDYLTALFPGTRIAPCLEILKEHACDIHGIVALNKIVHSLREEKKDNLIELLYLVTTLKYPRQKIGLYAKGKFIEQTRQRLFKNLVEQEGKLLISCEENHNTQSGQEALNKLIKRLNQHQEQERVQPTAIYLYLMTVYTDSLINQKCALSLADWHYQANNYQQSFYEYERFLYCYPGHEESVHVWCRLAGLYLQQEREDKALEAYYKAIMCKFDTGDYTYALKKIAMLYYGQKRSKQVSICQQIIWNCPDHKYQSRLITPETALLLANMFYEKKDYNQVIHEYQWFLYRYPEHEKVAYVWNRLVTLYLQQKRTDEALQACHRIIEFGPETEYYLPALESMAGAYYQKDNPKKAFSICQQIRQDFPEHEFSDTNIAELYLRKEKRISDKIKQLFDKLLFDYYPYASRVPRLDELFKEINLNECSRILENMPDETDAIVALNKMAELVTADYQSSDITAVLYFLASVKYQVYKIGNYAREKFIEEYEQSNTVLNNNFKTQPDVRLLKAVISNIGIAQSESVLLCLYVLAKYPDSKKITAEAIITLGDFYKEAEAYERAITQYEILLNKEYEIHIDSLSVLVRIADCYKNSNQTNEALQAYRRIADKYPDYKQAPLCLENAAKIHYERGETEQVLKICKKIRNRYPNYKFTESDLVKTFEKKREDIGSEVESLKEQIKKFPTPFVHTGEESPGVKAMTELMSFLDLEKDTQALSTYQEILAKYPDTKVGLLAQVKVAELLVSQGRIIEAAIKYQAIFQNNPGTEYALLAQEGIADCLYKHKEFVPALEAYKKIVLEYLQNDKIRKEDISALRVHKSYEDYTRKELIAEIKYLKGYLFLAKGNLWESVLSLNESRLLYEKLAGDLQAMERLMNVYFDLMIAYSQLGNYQVAAEYGQKVCRYHSITKRKDSPYIRQCTRRITATYQLGKEVTDFFKQYESAISRKNKTKMSSVQEKINRMQSLIQLLKKPPLKAKSSLGTKTGALVELLPMLVLYAQDQAITDSYKKSLLKYPDHSLNTDAFRLLTVYLFLTRDMEEAQDKFAEIIREYDKIQTGFAKSTVLASSFETLAGVYQGMGKKEEAIKVLRTIASRYSEEQGARAQQKIIDIYGTSMQMYSKAIEECRQLIKNFSDTEQAIHSQFLIGQFYYLQGDYRAALGEFGTYLDKHPKTKWTVGTRWYVALCYIRSRNHEQAVKTLREFIRSYPKDDMAARAQFLIGWSCMSQMKYTQAKRELQKLIDKHPEKRNLVTRAKSFIERAEKAQK
ncbi:tetratricopeptide repeat protein, partial [Candidatus Pacearchaeota archaeon]|nr:tetratricopeptide repeat protein [Candidatus Pacearchaeota archaeon]